MQFAPTRVRAKFGGFHISAHGCAKSPPDFILSNKDTPKTHPVLGLNLRRGSFGGVCNTPLHGYKKNLSGFIFPHTDTPKTHPISPFPIRIRPKPDRFYTQTFGEDRLGSYAIRPYTGMCKIWRVLGANPCRRTFGGVCFCAPTRVYEKFGGFHIFPIGMHPKPTRF